MNRLKELREQRKLSQPFVCSKLGICLKTLYNYEQGIGSIPDRALIKLAELYDVSVDYLLGRKMNIHAVQVSTRGLVEELRQREGVNITIAEPYQDIIVRVNGPALVLTITD